MPPSALLAACAAALLIPILDLIIRAKLRSTRTELSIVMAVGLSTVAWIVVTTACKWWPGDGDKAVVILAGLAVIGGGAIVWVEAVSLLSRGYSISILMDLGRAERGMMTVAQVDAGYGGGRGVDWLLDKRIDGLVRLGLVTRSGDDMHLTPAGSRAARLAGSAIAVTGLRKVG